MNRIPRELELQDSIEKYLTDHNIFPLSVTLTYKIGSGLLAITFYTENDLNEFLDLINYGPQCDKSGYAIINETKTIFLSGLPLVKLYTEV